MLQEGQKPGDVIIAGGSYRGGGTANACLPLPFPAAPIFAVVRALVPAAVYLGVVVTTGVGASSAAFYAPRVEAAIDTVRAAGGCFTEMESDTLFMLDRAEVGAPARSSPQPAAATRSRRRGGEAAYASRKAKMLDVALAIVPALA